MIILTDIISILLIIVGALFFIQMIYNICLYNNFYKYSRKNSFYDDKNNYYPPLSVIIVAKNSLSDLKKCLKHVLTQDYKEYEVIVIYEEDEDLYDDELKRLEESYNNLYHTFIPNSSRYISHKKLAITMGIKASKNEILVFTEPDSYPSSDKWLKSMARNFKDGTDVVIGYSNFDSKKGYFNRKIIFDRLLEFIRSMSWSILNKPYTASGYNLAYRKQAYYNNNGFASHLSLQRGEDDIFIHEIATKNNCKVELSPESIVRINPPLNKSIWREEKISRAITNKYCKSSSRFFYGFESISRLLLIISLVLLTYLSIINSEWVVVGIASLIIVLFFILQMFFLRRISRSLHEKRFFLILIYFDIVQPFWNLKYLIKRVFINKRDFKRF